MAGLRSQASTSGTGAGTGADQNRRAARLLALTVLGALLLPGCGPETPDFLKSTGPTRTEYRPLPAFHSVVVNDNVQVELAADGQAPAAEVTAGRNLLPGITTEVDAHGRLVVHNRNTFNWVRSYKRPVKVQLHLPPDRTFTIYQYGENPVTTAWPAMRLDSVFIHLVGAGDVDLDLTSRRIWLDQYEYGDIRLRGTCAELVATVGGVGWLQAQDLVCGKASAQGLRDGRLDLRVTGQLSVYLQGRGNAYYYQEPQTKNFHEQAEGRVLPAY